MKQFMKYAAVALGGYLVGFYEYKYKVFKAITEIYVNDMKDNSEKEEEESQ